MSLRFESKAILEDNEEKPIQNTSEATSNSSHSAYVPPIWQQLQTNAQAFQESYDDITKERFRGTKLLDEDEVDYLTNLDDSKLAVERQVRKDEEEQLRSFRQEQRQKSKSMELKIREEEPEIINNYNNISSHVQVESEKVIKRSCVPILAVRTVKRRVQDLKKERDDIVQEKPASPLKSGKEGELSNLIGCYESDESD